jgi:hypothetical protein
MEGDHVLALWKRSFHDATPLLIGRSRRWDKIRKVGAEGSREWALGKEYSQVRARCQYGVV